MKINVYGKEIEIDENNPGIKYFLEEGCEFPTENWIKTMYSHMIGYWPSNIEQVIKKMNENDLAKILKFGILEVLSEIAEDNNLDLKKEMNDVRMAF